ncbi:MAG: hypothetical protein A3G49_03350 [Candidatus Sungbacteria bacterium RIFCSPLOWO2_12_FULL_41_11]|uniref:General secretion pathway GspH domain-containing protein n=1 Tax=Candidatus Sungbacteria bacterium RIFCSPLOWO2_12_FULL_41_11 TaxID=1802286 RepID=A0A1G2LV45_9BACT|nr:MAG: hypothetical protein UV01_C0015G0023 [Parcubacteria group bacterium GW2011_GWA2_42_14]OGZ98299.1 MAG: hypothetical protein A3D41_04155 [Candidatus Sungbacteria bacterium RIFCSPHIGHO2_02_FULL_41_12b]OHA14742.1 MAG: hypothetical protein A3G49_03350 [Candidatus Sungbacteria bacterium RIFCSPLOWO2_12_FULL_41_11]
MKGTGLIEIIVYAAILTVISAFVVNSIVIINKALTRVRLERKLILSADQTMQKLIREIRQASDINASSTLDVTPGDLSLRTYVSATSTFLTDADFYLDSGRLVFKKNPASPIFLTDSDVVLTRLLFSQIIASSSKAIKFEMGLSASTPKSTASSTFYGTAILRGSYD